jgi:type I restriction enzyme S subunit
MRSTRLCDSVLKITESGLNNGSRLAAVDSILLLVRGSELHNRVPVGIATCPVAFNQDVKALQTREGLLPEFLLYWLLGNDKLLLSKVEETGIGAGKLDTDVLKRISMHLPCLAEQRSIVHILGALDDRIELNRQMNETLESMARALFKSWFIDFDPVHAKAEGRDPGLPLDIAALFPDSFEDSDVGEIPKGWAVRSLGELIKTVKGCSYTSDDLVDSDTALVTLKSFARGGGYRPDGLKSFAGSYKPEQVVTPGELVIACTDVTQAAAIVGRTAVVRGAAGYRTLVASLDTLIVRPNRQDVTRSFVYFLGRTDNFVAHTYSHTTGTTVLHLSKEAVPSFAFALPPVQLIREFDSLANPALSRIQASDEQSETIAVLRDTLLPKLMSGEIRVKDVERLLEASS